MDFFSDKEDNTIEALILNSNFYIKQWVKYQGKTVQSEVERRNPIKAMKLTRNLVWKNAEWTVALCETSVLYFRSKI